MQEGRWGRAGRPVGIWLLLANVLAGFAASAEAQNQNQAPPQNQSSGQSAYGCACLHNKTQIAVSYRLKWGDNPWKEDALRAGYQQAICWRYAQGSTSSPPLSFQLDVDLSGGKAWTTYDLALNRLRTAARPSAPTSITTSAIATIPTTSS